MARTPEGKIKDDIKKVLKAHATYYYMSVPYGYGAPTLDFTGCHRGRFFAIEAKAPGKLPTPRQELTAQEMKAAGAAVFVIDGPYGLEELKAWLSAQS
jgi:hypothetical protein